MNNTIYRINDIDEVIPSLVAATQQVLGVNRSRSSRDVNVSKPMRSISSLILCLVLGLLVSSVAGAKKFTILTEPVVDGRVLVDGQFVGVAPVTLDIKVRKKNPAEITVEKEGARMEESKLVTPTQQSRIVVRLVATSKEYQIVTQPVVDGRVFIDGEFVGIAPLAVNLSLTNPEPIVITAEKSEAIGQWPRRVKPSVADAETTISIRLEDNIAFKETEESDMCNKWITVTPRRTLDDSDRTWQKLVSLITDSFPDLQQVDRTSYYIRSAWRVREYAFNVFRHRLVVKRGVGDDFTLRLMIESQLAPKSEGRYRDEEFRSSRRIFPADNETIEFIRDQL